MSAHFVELDAAILALFDAGPKTASYINERLGAQSRALAKPDRYGDRNGWRVVDRRLQTLRKAGKIKTDNKAWSLA